MSGQKRPGTNLSAALCHQTTNRVLLNPSVKASESAKAAVFHSPLIVPLHCMTVSPLRLAELNMTEGVTCRDLSLVAACINGLLGTVGLTLKVIRPCASPEADLILISPSF